MIFKKHRKQPPIESIPERNIPAAKTPRDIEHMAFLQVSSRIIATRDWSAILELIAREGHNILRASRSTVFLLEPEKGILKTHFIHSPDPADEQVGVFEEKEVARKALFQMKPFLLKQPEDFAHFFKYGSRDKKITSLMSVPLSTQSRVIGVFSVAIINDSRSFNDKNLQFLSILGNYASIALEIARLRDEINQGNTFRKTYEQHLDDILNQLQSLTEEERRRIEEHIGKFISGQKNGERRPGYLKYQPGEEPPKTAGTINLTGELELADGGEEVPEKVQVEFESKSLGTAADLMNGGIFIRTPNPLDLGEAFFLKLHMADGGDPVEVACKVILSNKYGKETSDLRRGMGVKFLNLDPEIQKRIEQFILSHKNKELSFEEERDISSS